MIVRVKKLDPKAKLPYKATSGSAFYDVYSIYNTPLPCGVISKIGIGLAFEVPEGYEMEIRPRSSLTAKGIVLIHSPGTLDSDYRGELQVLLMNFNTTSYEIKQGDRIAQIAIRPISDPKFIETKELEDTIRGNKGFGSTGR